MSNTFTLDSLREEADKEFAPLKVALSDGTEAVLGNVLRLGKTAREDVSAALKLVDELQASEEDGEDKFAKVTQLADAIEQILQLVSPKGAQLVTEIDGDLGVLITVLNKWLGDTEAGEASNSPASSTATASS